MGGRPPYVWFHTPFPPMPLSPDLEKTKGKKLTVSRDTNRWYYWISLYPFKALRYKLKAHICTAPAFPWKDEGFPQARALHPAELQASSF